MPDMVKWNPFGDITRIFNEVDKLFANLMKPFSDEVFTRGLAKKNLNLQVREENQEIIITGDIPGAIKDKVDVALHEDRVAISGETEAKEEKDGQRAYSWSRFTVIEPLPVRVKSESATVSLKDGKLAIRVKKA